MKDRVRVGILDSGVDAEHRHLVFRGLQFEPGKGAVTNREKLEDQIGHGTEMTRLIAEAGPQAEIHHAQVFGARFSGAPMVVAAGLDWLRAQKVQLVCMSFGMPVERAVLRKACDRAINDEILLVAAAPAQGDAVFPASWPGVISVTGDARCRQKGQITDLQGVQADFGTWCASPEHRGGKIAGSSVAAAHFTGLAANFLCENPRAGRDALMTAFRKRVIHFGPEKRAAEVGSR